MKLKSLAALIGAGLLAATAQAGTTSVWRFQDDSIDFILRVNATGGYDLVTKGPVLLDDIFVGIFEFPRASATPGGSLIPPGQELTGVSAVRLDRTLTGGPPSDPASGAWIFQPVRGGLNSILALGGHPGVVGGAADGGAVAAMWLNGVAGGADRDLVLDAADPDWGTTTNCTSLADCLQQASLGRLFQVDGLWGVDKSDRYDRDNYWRAAPSPLFGLGPITYDAVHAGDETAIFGVFSAGLSNLWNIVGTVGFEKIGFPTPCPGAYVLDGCVQVKVTGNILGGAGLKNGAVARDDMDARKLVMVPEPATLGLLGLGLLGLGLLRRRMA